jgi:hypothetical protein
MKNGGPAFPRPASQAADGHRDNRPAQQGMTLRDYFAAAALPALITAVLNPGAVEGGITLAVHEKAMNEGRVPKAHLAHVAYEYADLMLAEREKEPS